MVVRMGLAAVLVVFVSIPAWADDNSPQPRTAKFGDWRITITPQTREVAPTTVAAVPGIVIAPQVATQSAGRGQAPAGNLPPNANAPAGDRQPGPTAGYDPLVMAANYAAVYDSIPFLRSEYDQNPTYRHDATMEILFGQMRPTIVNRQIRVAGGGDFVPDPGSFGPYSPFGGWGGGWGGGGWGGGPNPYFRFYNPYWRWYGYLHGYW